MSRTEPIRTRDHIIGPDLLDENAVKVLRRLNQFGYSAYLVGGGVRDLLLRRRPKDYDVATDARPEEVRALFRNCRLIGRRFRLAHIIFAGHQIVEVSTFRAQPESSSRDGELITDDNVFGCPESDAVRRDFSINALFYDYATGEVIDYVGGLADLDDCELRTIGDPTTRFREDPVRMLRAVKFAARLGFELGDGERRAIREERGELRKAAIPRLLEELLRMLWGGAAATACGLLTDLGLLDLLLPEVASFLSQPGPAPREQLHRMLLAVDDRCAGQRNLDTGVLLAACFWPLYRALVEELPAPLEPRFLRSLAHDLVVSAAIRLRLPRRDTGSLMAALAGQYRLDGGRSKRRGRGSIVRDADFPAILDLLELRSSAEPLPAGVLQAWRDKAAGLSPVEPSRRRSRGGRRGRRRSS